MKMLIGVLSAALSFSAYGLSFSNNAQEGFGNIDIQGIALLRDGIEGTNPGTLIEFKNFNQSLYDQGIPMLSIDLRRHDGQSHQYRVWAPNYDNVGWPTVYAQGCEITFNGKSLGSADFSDQCF